MGLLSFFYYGAFIAFVLAEIARVQITPFLGITLLDVMVSLLICCWLYFSHRQKISLIAKTLTRPFIFVVLSMIISLVVNSFFLKPMDLFFSSLFMIRWIVYALILGIVPSFSIQLRAKIRYCMIASGMAIIFLGIIQYVFYSSLRNLFYLGWDDHLYRLFSTFLDPNFSGMFLVIFLLFILPFLRDSIQRKDQHKAVLWAVLSSVAFISVLLTYSRGAYIMLIVGIFVYLFLNGKKVLAGISILIILITIMFSANTKVEGLNPFRTASSNARLESMKNALQISRDHPLFGVGFNAYRYAQIAYGFRVAYTPFPSHSDSGTDNSFLFIFTTTGIIGFAAYLYFLYSLGKGRLHLSRKNHLSQAFIASLISWGVGSFFINGLFYSLMLFWMWTFYGVTEE